MATIAMGSSAELSAEVMSQMHEFRHDVFVKRLKWPLATVEGRERDQYDTSEAKYVVMYDAVDRVSATARILPTTSTYMLPELFPQLLGNAPAPRDPAVWELSRFATSVRATGEGRVLSLSDQTFALLDSVFELAREYHVKELILVTSVAIERLMIRAKMEVCRLAPPSDVDGRLCVALLIKVPAEAPEERTLDLRRPARSRSRRRRMSAPEPARPCQATNVLASSYAGPPGNPQLRLTDKRPSMSSAERAANGVLVN